MWPPSSGGPSRCRDLRSIIVRGVVYSELSVTALSEAEFESILLRHAAMIAPECFVVPFKCDVTDGQERRRADLAAISKDYSHWSVIEVEMWGHDLWGHVLPQIGVLRDGVYGTTHVNYLLGKMPALDREGLIDLMKGDPPDVVVMVNQRDDDWSREIRIARCRLSVFEMYRSALDEYAFVLDGPLLSQASNLVSRLTCGLPGLARFLKVGSPGKLGIKSGERITANANGVLIEMERFDAADTCYLKVVGPVTLKPGVEYRLVQTGSTFSIESSVK